MAAETCVVCGIRLPKLAIQDGDAYFSSDCCRVAHQVPLGLGIRTIKIGDVIVVTQEEDERVDS
jgi:hypothetical protein